MMNEELASRFRDFGALGYDDARMQSVLGVSKRELARLKKAGGAEEYRRGHDGYTFEADRALAELARGGDHEARLALERYQSRLS